MKMLCIVAVSFTLTMFGMWLYGNVCNPCWTFWGRRFWRRKRIWVMRQPERLWWVMGALGAGVVAAFIARVW